MMQDVQEKLNTEHIKQEAKDVTTIKLVRNETLFFLTYTSIIQG